jgi:predicted short-subunit dehydrogenase-like oxidoreductase (DUF2520 family)
MNASLRGRTVSVTGRGRVGATLAAALTDAGFPVVTDRPADLAILAVPDDALATVVAGLDIHPGQIVAHTSGAHGLGILAPAVARGARPLAVHPAMTFTGGPEDLARLRKGIPFGVTAPPDLRPLAGDLVRALGGTPEWIADEHRTLYHAALAHGANHLVTLVSEALDLLRAAGAAHPERLLDPLLHAALDNTLRLGDAALTGPVSRGDTETVAAHLAALADVAPAALPAYRVLAARTADRAVAAGRLTAAEAEPIQELL